jgi:CheY-like chemotaxis protein
LTNLCDNAIKFTDKGSITVDARRGRLSSHQNELHLSVRDTGVGIPESKLTSIFGAFNQADSSTTREYGGTGLGLTICARLVELMGGKIWVKSEPGNGSVFHFTVRLLGNNPSLAAQGAVTFAPQTLPKASLEPIKQQPPSTLKILLVEDNLVNQKLAMVLIKKWGHDCTLAQNGQEAVALFPTQHWDLVLMDMQMPVMGGLEATRLIRESELPGRHTPILAMTANAMASDRQACLDAGMDDHLSKPLNSKALQASIEKLAHLSL